MVKLVVYLAGADYKVREEREVDEDEIDTKAKQKKLQQEMVQKLINDYGKHWRNVRKKQVNVAGFTAIKKKVFEQRIVIKGKDYGIKKIQQKQRIFRKWSRHDEKRVLLLTQQGKSYRQIQRMTKRTYESVRSKILRLKGKKKK